MKDFAVGGKKASGYLASPKASAAPGVLVLHAWWGLNDFFKRICERLASEGFVAFAPDLYHGATASTVDEAKRLRSKLKGPVVVKEIAGALDYLQDHSAVRGKRIGVVGFSLGGYWALGLAGQKPQDVRAVVVFYGIRKVDKRARAAFLGHFAEEDKFVRVDKVRQLEKELRSAGKDFGFHLYPGTKHWFFEEDRAEAYNEVAARLAWQRTIEFLKAKLSQ